jgi:hypothetical protein
MPLFGSRSNRTPPGPGAAASAGVRSDANAAAIGLAELYETKVATDDGRIRVEDLLSAAAAVCGEACIAAGAEFDPEDHRFTAGSPVLSDRVNAILCANAPDWAGAAQSVFGLIRAGALSHGYVPDDFPPLAEPLRRYAASLGGGGDPPVGWGYVALGVPDANLPFVQPLRQAFELREPARGIMAAHQVPTGEWPFVCGLALVVELTRVREAIDRGVAIRIVLETVNGMAKMAPMTARHLHEAEGGGS